MPSLSVSRVTASGRAEGARSSHGTQFILIRSADPYSHGRPEQPGEHGAVHEGTQVAEHRLDLDLGIVWEQRQEELLVGLTRCHHD